MSSSHKSCIKWRKYLEGATDSRIHLQFGHKLLEEEGAAPKEFKKSFIKYKSLKKFLKYRRLNTAVLGGPEGLEAEKDFLRLLHSQLKVVDRYSNSSTAQTNRALILSHRSQCAEPN